MCFVPCFAVSPSVQKEKSRRHSDDPFAGFDNDFMPEMEEMDKQDRIHSELNAGFDKWEDRCVKVGGQDVLDDWLAAQENLVYCVMQNFDITTIQAEVEDKKKTGDLDLVFQKYCGYDLFTGLWSLYHICYASDH